VGERIVVVGGGQAACQLVDSLRREGFERDIVLVSEEPHLPYQRPPLSKQFLAGELDESRLFMRKADYYEKQRIETRLGLRAVRLDRDRQSVELADGSQISFTGLALTTGARARPLAVPGAGLDGVFYLRNIADVRAIRERMGRARRVVIIGGGFIGLEVAAVARKLGKEVCVLEFQNRLMPRATAPFLSDYYYSLHTRHGVDIRTGTAVDAIEKLDAGLCVRCADGANHLADLIVVGVGVIPNIELARDAGLACDDGIRVDEFARTDDPRIVAAGDCTSHPNVLLARRLRLESVHNAMEQAKSAAATLCGKRLAYAQIPWFWSDQFDAKLQMVGLSQEHDQYVLRGSAESGKFSIFYYRGGELIAVDSINSPKDHLQARKLLTARISPSPEQAADVEFDLKSLL
jgi:3-phenylpropionate/trans-cinnamate dioxygenase ferredoxin reductase subunit